MMTLSLEYFGPYNDLFSPKYQTPQSLGYFCPFVQQAILGYTRPCCNNLTVTAEFYRKDMQYQI